MVREYSRIAILERLERRAEGDGEGLVVRHELAGHVDVRELPALRSLRETDVRGPGRVLTGPAARRGSAARVSPRPP